MAKGDGKMKNEIDTTMFLTSYLYAQGCIDTYAEIYYLIKATEANELLKNGAVINELLELFSESYPILEMIREYNETIKK